MANVFNIGISALVSAQHQLSTTSHNIANVNTDGYSRQRVELTQFPPQPTSSGFLGNGVRVSEITRIADQFLIGQLRTANANEAKAAAYATYSGQVDSLLGDGSVTKAL
jgi:flagellar hook-associated protein 1 FlgK